ncbi:uncharacterized protein PV09_01632 [Verruconis gallopava]|uniref:RBR-type E3 ubiquitin transferase n=1 Tax=Verruconis gallopava TaxID=253628 RepID=A0A0D2B8W0_9PEZI|nr:uncharacterized protein PV09_01632 [Verruconis gallopava]KIW07694.1 hypothetical protein PV09_01632 [Verruconis gallopava]
MAIEDLKNPEAAVRSWGFSRVFTWTDGPNAHYPPHSHDGLTTHLIKKGQLTITYPNDESPRKETFGVGSRIDVDAHRVHEVWMGPEGYDFPLDDESGNRVLITCTECIGNELRGVRHERTRRAEGEDVVEPLPPDPPRKRRRVPREDHPWRRKKARTAIKPQAQQQRLRKTSATCRICIEEKPLSDFPNPGPTVQRAIKRGILWHTIPLGDVPPRCVDHLTVNRNNKSGPVCRECIGASLLASIDLKGADRVGCPDENCDQLFDPIHYVAKYLSSSDFNAYSEKLFDTWRKVNKMLQECINPDCRATVLIESNTPGYPHVQCVYCKMHICVSCRVEWHRGQTCVEYRWEHVDDAKSKAEIQALKNLQKQGARRCPHCSLAVIKDGGCPSMWCTHCNRAFWWESATRVTAVQSRKITRAQKRDDSASVPPYYRTAECEADRLERLEREQATRALEDTSSTPAAA